jgi:hypothetical protein
MKKFLATLAAVATFAGSASAQNLQNLTLDKPQYVFACTNYQAAARMMSALGTVLMGRLTKSSLEKSQDCNNVLNSATMKPEEWGGIDNAQPLIVILPFREQTETLALFYVRGDSGDMFVFLANKTQGVNTGWYDYVGRTYGN